MTSSHQLTDAIYCYPTLATYAFLCDTHTAMRRPSFHGWRQNEVETALEESPGCFVEKSSADLRKRALTSRPMSKRRNNAALSR